MRAFVVLVPLLTGCFAVADVDQFEKRDDLIVHLSGFAPHAGQRVEVRLVNQDDITDLVVVARAVLEPMVDDHVFVMPLAALPAGSYGVDVFVDEVANGEYDLGELLWRSELGPDRKLRLESTAMTTDIMDPPTRSEGTDFVLSLHGMSVHSGEVQRLEVLVVDRTEARAVGYAFVPDIETDNIEIVIPDIIEAGHDYHVDFYADASKNGRYDDPGVSGDHTWREEGTGTAEDVGLRIEFTHQAIFDDVAVSFPHYEP